MPWEEFPRLTNQKITFPSCWPEFLPGCGSAERKWKRVTGGKTTVRSGADPRPLWHGHVRVHHTWLHPPPSPSPGRLSCCPAKGFLLGRTQCEWFCRSDSNITGLWNPEPAHPPALWVVFYHKTVTAIKLLYLIHMWRSSYVLKLFSPFGGEYNTVPRDSWQMARPGFKPSFTYEQNLGSFSFCQVASV